MSNRKPYGKYYRQLLRKKGTTRDRIIASYKHPDLLSDQEIEIKNRLRATWSMLLSNRRKSDIVAVLINDFGVNESQAYADINNAGKLYGNLQKSDKEAVRAMHYELAQEIFNLARGEGDLKNMLGALDRMNELQGVNVDEGGLQDPESLKASVFVIQLQGKDGPIDVDLKDIHKLGIKDQKKIEKAINVGAIPDVEDIEALIDSKDES